VPFSDDASQLVVFSLGVERYALPVVRLLEVVDHAELRPLPFADPSIEGVLSVRRELIPVCDLARRLQVSAPRADDSVIVIVKIATRTVGLTVDALEDVMTVDSGGLDAVPVADTELVQAITRLGEHLVVLLDPESLFAATALATPAAAA
jgi:purine-binding chemotaxis protein CheW